MFYLKKHLMHALAISLYVIKTVLYLFVELRSFLSAYIVCRKNIIID